MPPRVSLSMIVKNEEANLPACLESVADLVDEIVVVDTGSTDRTKDVAARFGARLYDFAWVDDFAAARNESLRHCTGRWVLWLDADDRVDEENRRRMRAVFAGLQDDLAVYMMRYRCAIGAVDGTTSMIDYARVFPNHPQVRWRYRVHEQIMPAVCALGGAVRLTDVVVDHTGYADPALTRRKHERNLRLLAMEDQDRPGNPQTLLNIALAQQGLGQPAESMPYLGRCLEILPAGSSMAPKVYSLLVQGHQWLGQPEQARAACREGRNRFPEDTELLYREVLLCQEAGDLAGAARTLLHMVETRPTSEAMHNAMDPAIRGHRGRHELAMLYYRLGRLGEAETQWRAALMDQPDYTPAWLGLGELLLRQSRWNDLERTVQKLDADPRRGVEAAVLRARGHMVRQNLAAARGELETACARSPGSWWPRLLLGDLLLQEGRDWAAAEKVLRELLAIDPDHAATQNKLAAVLARQGRS